MARMTTEREARRIAREWSGLNRLPRGFETWKENPHDRSSWRLG